MNSIEFVYNWCDYLTPCPYCENIKVGSIIFMDKYSGKKVLDNGTEYILAKEAEIVGIEN